LKRGPVLESSANETLPLSLLSNLLDLLEQPILVSDRTGRILFTNMRGEQRLESLGFKCDSGVNLFSDVLHLTQKVILDQIEAGEHRVHLELGGHSGKLHARIQWLPEADWLVVRIEEAEEPKDAVPVITTQHTVQELLQEREITYRNLLAAYLRLQEVNRQKTVFLASAAHEETETLELWSIRMTQSHRGRGRAQVDDKGTRLRNRLRCYFRLCCHESSSPK